MSVVRSFTILAVALFTAPTVSFATEAPDTQGAEAKAESKDEPRPRPVADTAAAKKCDAHGVKKTICARCKPKLAAAYKSKGDWCSEHERPESQCAICKPDLKKEGVKP